MNKLALRSILATAFLMGFLALALFGSAGSLDYWQGWVHLVVFIGGSGAITAYLARCDRRLLARRLASGPTAEVRRSQQIIQAVATVLFLAPYVVAGLDFRFGWSGVPALASWLGNLFVLLGFYIVFLTFRENTYASATIEVADEQTVITSGPYAWLRHPMYAGASIFILFTPIALGSWIGLPFAAALVAVVIVRLLDEERFLSENLPGYREYLGKVRWRLIPFVW